MVAGCAHGGPPASEPPNTLPSAAPPPASVASVSSASPASPTPAPATPGPPAPPTKVELHETAMGTTVTFIAFTNARVDEGAARAAMGRALDEMRRLETLMSEWHDD